MSRTYTRDEVQAVVEEVAKEGSQAESVGMVTGDIQVAASGAGMARGAREVLRRLDALPEATPPTILDAFTLLGRALRSNSGGIHTMVTLEVRGDHFDAISRGLAGHKYSSTPIAGQHHIHCETGEVPIRVVRAQRPRSVTPVPEVPALKAEPTAPDVVWRGEGVEVRSDGSTSGIWSDVWHMDKRSKALARALAEAKREQREERAILNKIERDRCDTINFLTREGVRERAKAHEVRLNLAESMRERAAKALELRAMKHREEVRGSSGVTATQWRITESEARICADVVRTLPLEEP